LIDESKIDLESLLRAAGGYKDPPELSPTMLQAGRIDFSSGFVARFARQFAALWMARPLVEQLPKGVTLKPIDKTGMVLYFLSASKRLPPTTAGPGNARGQGKEPN
jgi:hypothetical protein